MPGEVAEMYEPTDAELKDWINNGEYPEDRAVGHTRINGLLDELVQKARGNADPSALMTGMIDAPDALWATRWRQLGWHVSRDRVDRFKRKAWFIACKQVANDCKAKGEAVPDIVAAELAKTTTPARPTAKAGSKPQPLVEVFDNADAQRPDSQDDEHEDEPFDPEPDVVGAAAPEPADLSDLPEELLASLRAKAGSAGKELARRKQRWTPETLRPIAELFAAIIPVELYDALTATAAEQKRTKPSHIDLAYIAAAHRDSILHQDGQSPIKRISTLSQTTPGIDRLHPSTVGNAIRLLEAMGFCTLAQEHSRADHQCRVWTWTPPEAVEKRFNHLPPLSNKTKA